MNLDAVCINCENKSKQECKTFCKPNSQLCMKRRLAAACAPHYYHYRHCYRHYHHRHHHRPYLPPNREMGCTPALSGRTALTSAAFAAFFQVLNPFSLSSFTTVLFNVSRV